MCKAGRTIEEIDLYVTEKCNLNCEFCSVEANTRRTRELSKEVIFSVIEEAMNFGLEQLHLTGGEPTLRNDLEEIIEFAVKKGLHVRLITNGTLLSSQRLYTFYNKGLRSIMISLDGLEVYHDKVRGTGNYRKAMELIQYALTLSGMVVRVNSVAWKDNQSDILELTRILNQLGVEIYSIFLGSPLGYAKKLKNNVLSCKEYKAFTSCEKIMIQEKKMKMSVAMEKGFLFEDEEKYERNHLRGRGVGCSKINEGSDYFLIRGDGDVYPCVFFANEGEKVGNVIDTSFREIMDSFYCNEFYCGIGQVPEECNSCIHVKLCKGGCRGYAKIYTNNWKVKDPRCSGQNSKVFPTCPIMKINLNNGAIGGSSEQVVNLESK